MCGIFGYIGHNTHASTLVLQGLKSLEYRGYDSWGVASQKDARIILEKHTGKIGKATLSPKLSNTPSTLAIGHTRWATHGGVTDINAHPHLDCSGQIAVLHNGIVENYQELKKQLLKNGHKFISDTDTEVIAHLLEEEYMGSRRGGPTSSTWTKQSKGNRRMVEASDRIPTFQIAVQKTFNLLKGLNAIVAINTQTHQIAAAKNGSPLIIGIGNKEYFVASDAAAILPHTRKIIFLKDNQLITLDQNLQLYSLPKGHIVKPKIEKIDWKIEQAELGHYPHFMLKEINEQPQIISSIAQTYAPNITQLSRLIQKAKGTFFIGCGTAYHACLAGTYLFSKIANIHVNTAPASEFNYLEHFLNSQSLIIPLSQSGETIDVIEPLNRALSKKSKILSLTNVLGSTIYRLGNYKLLLGAGPEKAVASTKAYTAKLSILTLFAYSLINKINEGQKILHSSALEIKRLLTKPSLNIIQKIAQTLSSKEHIYIIGRGVSYATALEGALKIKEVSYIHTEGLAGGELKHGTIALISQGTPVIVIAPNDETYDAIISNAIEIKSRGGHIIGISSIENPIFDLWIEVRETESPLLTQIIPLQLLAYYIALEKNLDPDKPRNLAKSVTVK